MSFCQLSVKDSELAKNGHVQLPIANCQLPIPDADRARTNSSSFHSTATAAAPGLRFAPRLPALHDTCLKAQPSQNPARSQPDPSQTPVRPQLKQSRGLSARGSLQSKASLGLSRSRVQWLGSLKALVFPVLAPTGRPLPGNPRRPHRPISYQVRVVLFAVCTYR